MDLYVKCIGHITEHLCEREMADPQETWTIFAVPSQKILSDFIAIDLDVPKFNLCFRYLGSNVETFYHVTWGWHGFLDIRCLLCSYLHNVIVFQICHLH